MTAATPICVICEKGVHSAVDAHVLCFGGGLAQNFVAIIEKQTNLDRREALVLAVDLAEYARGRLLEFIDEGEVESVLADVRAGMVRECDA